MKNTLLVSLSALIVSISINGCSSPKTVEYEPYTSNSYLYREIVDKNKLGWKSSLLPDVQDYKDYLTSTFNKIDNNKVYLEKMHNINIKKIKREAPRKSKKLNYSDFILNDEYTF